MKYKIFSIKDNIFDIEDVINNNNNNNNNYNYKEYEKDKEDIINKFYLIENKIKEFSFDNTYHTIEECKSNDSLDKHSKSTLSFIR